MQAYENKKYQEIFSQSKENWEWFTKYRGKLLEEYPEQFVFIAERRVVAHNPDLDRLFKMIPSEYREKEHWIEYLSKEGRKFVL